MITSQKAKFSKMPAHLLKLENCRAGFQSVENVSCSVLYASKIVLFSEETHSVTEEYVKVIPECITLHHPSYVVCVITSKWTLGCGHNIFNVHQISLHDSGLKQDIKYLKIK